MRFHDPAEGPPPPVPETRARSFGAEALGILSHDLNNALSVILTSSASLLRREPADQTTHRQLELIQRSALRIHELTEELTDAVAVDLGQIEFKLAPLEAGEVIADAVAAAQSLAQQRSLRFSGLREAHWIRGDRSRLQRVFAHLLRSALAASLDGVVEVTLETRPPEICVQIHDGASAAPASSPETNAAFRPAESQRRSLARYVSQGVVQAHGGRFWIEPREAGSAFLICLPATEHPAAAR
jgi:signal transduction histidine kinase